MFKINNNNNNNSIPILLSKIPEPVNKQYEVGKKWKNDKEESESMLKILIQTERIKFKAEYIYF